jgi:acetyl-CoA C-acetyltransferase
MSVIAAYQRTPYGRFLGGLSSLSGSDLGAHALRAALLSAGVEVAEVDYVIAGQVLQAGQGQNPARQAALAAGLPLTTPATTLNAVCLSGMEAIVAGHRLIAAGEASIVACLGQESMSRAPHIVYHSRLGKKYGAIEMLDSIEIDGLTDALLGCSMGLATEDGNSDRSLTRVDQDAWALESHQRASQSHDFFAGEIAPVTITVGRNKVSIESDEGIRHDADSASMAALRPAFSPEGTITAGNASPISDGAAAIVLMSEEEASRRAVIGFARVLSHALVSGPDTQLHSQPSSAIRRALARRRRSVEELALVEINEAFASVALQSMADLGVDRNRVNVHGGAIALGHPIGSSGTRIVGTLARMLSEYQPGALAGAGICGGGGQGSAMILEAL